MGRSLCHSMFTKNSGSVENESLVCGFGSSRIWRDNYMVIFFVNGALFSSHFLLSCTKRVCVCPEKWHSGSARTPGRYRWWPYCVRGTSTSSYVAKRSQRFLDSEPSAGPLSVARSRTRVSRDVKRSVRPNWHSFWVLYRLLGRSGRLLVGDKWQTTFWIGFFFASTLIYALFYCYLKLCNCIVLY